MVKTEKEVISRIPKGGKETFSRVWVKTISDQAPTIVKEIYPR